MSDASTPPPPTPPPPTPPGPPVGDLPPPPDVPLATPPPADKPFWKRWWVIAIAAVVVIAIIGAIAGGGDGDDDAVGTESGTTDAVTPPPPESTQEEAGEAGTTEPEAPATETTEAAAETTEAAPETTEGAPDTTEAAPDTTEPPTTTAPTTTLPQIPGFDSGVQLVGQDVQPGVYTTPGADGFNCYFERLAGVSGELDDIIANGNASGPVIIEIAATDVAFSSNGCQRWTAFLGAAPVESFSDGDWAIGQQVTPGRWSTEGDPNSFNCYWERASGFTHTLNDIIANENTEGRAIVDISASDVRFTTTGCGTWTRIG